MRLHPDTATSVAELFAAAQRPHSGHSSSSSSYSMSLDAGKVVRASMCWLGSRWYQQLARVCQYTQLRSMAADGQCLVQFASEVAVLIALEEAAALADAMRMTAGSASV